MANRQKWAQALQGLGAGLTGQGVPYMRNQMVQNQFDEAQRRRDLLQQAYQVQTALSAGRPWEAQDLLLKRFDKLRQEGVDSSDTMALLKQIDAGDTEGALREVSALTSFGLASGELQIPGGGQQQRDRMQVVGNQIVNMDQGSAAPIAGYVEDPAAVAERSIAERRVSNAEAEQARQAQKISAPLETVLLNSQQASIDRQGDAVNFNTIANEFETRSDEFYGGAKMTVNEGLKALLGSQDEVTEFRRKINAIRVSEGIGQLPPGVASDKDIELVMSGQIRENAGPEQVAMYLRGAAKIAQYDAGYNQMRVDFINKNRTGAGLNNAWRKTHTSTSLKRKVTAAEIYRAAMNKGITIEDAMAALGVEGELF